MAYAIDANTANKTKHTTRRTYTLTHIQLKSVCQSCLKHVLRLKNSQEIKLKIHTYNKCINNIRVKDLHKSTKICTYAQFPQLVAFTSFQYYTAVVRRLLLWYNKTGLTTAATKTGKYVHNHQKLNILYIIEAVRKKKKNEIT